jgi:hypothetical protein
MGLTESTPGELIRAYYGAKNDTISHKEEVDEAYSKMIQYINTMLTEEDILNRQYSRITVTSNGTVQLYCPKSMKLTKDMFSGLENIFGHNNIYMTETQTSKKNEGIRIINISNDTS